MSSLPVVAPAPNLLARLAGATAPVDRRLYAVAGFSLMALKYAIEASLAWFAAGAVLTPPGFLSPVLSTRLHTYGTGEEWVAIVAAALSLPFAWVSTGPFVEPITAWDAPYHLAFDVRSSPPTMHEWSPYERVHAPHLDGILQSRRGEFVLTRLPDGGARLEGHTWYTFAMAPEGWWTLWSDVSIHAIHSRVLRHIADVSEVQAG